MNQRIDAVFENGMFRPESPVNMAEGQRVSLNVESGPASELDMSDIGDLLDVEFTATCQASVGPAPSLEEVRAVLSAFDGSLADRICEERDER